MEKMMTVEEKVRRAEEIYERRRKNNARPVATVNIRDKKDIKLLKKMIIQLLVCISIYLIIYSIQNNNYVFSQDFINKANEILSYDTNFQEIYSKIKSEIINFIKPKETTDNQEIDENKQEENNIGGIGGPADATIEEEQIQQEIKQEDTQNITQVEQDILTAKNTTTFIKPIEGTISSKYGIREQATGNVPKNHTGTDIVADIGTKIKSATDGEVVLLSEEGDYRKTLKDTNRRN